MALEVVHCKKIKSIQDIWLPKNKTGPLFGACSTPMIDRRYRHPKTSFTRKPRTSLVDRFKLLQHNAKPDQRNDCVEIEYILTIHVVIGHIHSYA